MGRYPVDPLDVTGLHTYPLQSRKSKVTLEELAGLPRPGGSFRDFWQSLPRLLAAADLKVLAERMKAARRDRRAIVWGLGAHVIKVGLSPLLIHLMEKGFVSGAALNGAGIIHDFEMALVGRTSEEVEEGLSDGQFGMAEETGSLLNRAVAAGAARGAGLGEAVGAFIDEQKPPFMYTSLLWAGYRLGIPVTVHVALGTDIIHMHPGADGAAIGKASLHDFRLLAAVVRGLDRGGVYLNVGSAVILPEVFLKAVSVVRNVGHPLEDFTTASFDFLRHYRPRKNVVERPTAGSGRGFEFVGHHEIMIPLLATALTDGD